MALIGLAYDPASLRYLRAFVDFHSVVIANASRRGGRADLELRDVRRLGDRLFHRREDAGLAHRMTGIFDDDDARARKPFGEERGVRRRAE
jgi:hypothetical protein